jgi:O-antigen ligase
MRQFFKYIFSIDDTPANKISYYHLLLFLVMLPFDRFYSELILISFAIHTLMHAKRFSIADFPLKKVLLAASIFFITLLSAFYAAESTDGFNKPGRQIALLLLPLLFTFTKLDIARYKQRLLLAFSVTCIVLVLYLYYDALHIIHFDKLPLKELFSGAFMNHNFSKPIELHATYFAMYICFSLTYFIVFLLQTRSKINKYLLVFSILILIAGLVQTGSKAVMIAALICVIFIVPLNIEERKKQIAVNVAGLSICAVLISTVYFTPIFHERYVGGLSKDLSMRPGVPSIPEPRLARWKSALTLINKAPFIGYGTGMETPVLKQQYFADKLFISYYAELNAHNEYLSVALNSGYIGLLLFLGLLLICYRIALRQRNVMFLCFLTIITVTSFSENILDLNKGIFFVAFFLSLFLLLGSVDGQQRQATFSE